MEKGHQLYLPRVEAKIASATAQLVARGGNAGTISTGIFKDLSSIKVIKVSAKELQVTYARSCLLEGKSGSNPVSGRKSEAEKYKGPARCRLLRGTTQTTGSTATTLQEEFGRSLYCAGVGTTSEDCIMRPGLFRLSVPGPGIPTLLSACNRRIGTGAIPLTLRMHRTAFMTRVLKPKTSLWYES